ncbi:hypothetical protein [Flavobacterium sp. CAU 1735]|uniref:hypothetical protein n=1 Tax=Flavobacterium sp. CAU 1735 TaxID=3140361 RepID=UPI00326054EA
MKFSKIRMAFRLVIDSSTTVTWQKYVFEDTYREYRMQQQLYNNPENPKPTFRELLYENEKAEKLHFLTGMAAEPYIRQLKGNIYELQDALGNSYLPFVNYKLDIVNTDSNDQSRHKIGITFYTPLMVLVDIVDRHYLLSTDTDATAHWEILSFPMHPNLAICYLEKENE